jgi:preprotein translocase subunit SecG
MIDLLPIAQILVALFLSGVILLQAKGTGLGTTFGGGGEFYRSKRGIEKLLFFVTIGLAILFLVLSLVGVAL